MRTQDKSRAVVSFDKLKSALKDEVKKAYPRGYSKHLITFDDITGKKTKGLRYESEDRVYLIRMSSKQAEALELQAREALENALTGGTKKIRSTKEVVNLDGQKKKKTKTRKKKAAAKVS